MFKDGILVLGGGWSILYLSSITSESMSLMMSTTPKQQLIFEHLDVYIIFKIPSKRALTADINKFVVVVSIYNNKA